MANNPLPNPLQDPELYAAMHRTLGLTESQVVMEVRPIKYAIVVKTEYPEQNYHSTQTHTMEIS